MSNEIVIPANMGQLPAGFTGMNTKGELGGGIESSFAIVGYKGKVWSLRYNGNETKLMRDDGDGPRGSIEVVILKAPGYKSKMFYGNGYEEGSNAAPDCSSSNGQTPDPGVKAKQAETCAACPKNIWGSATTPGGKQAKACTDYKRLVVAPLGDLNNEAFGGPMLLRIPAGSLKALQAYADALDANKYPYCAVGTRIGFDPNEAFPKFVFSPIRVLTNEEAGTVMELRDDPRVNRILAQDTRAAVASAPAPAIAFEQPAPPQAPKVATPAQKPVSPPAASAPVVPEVQAPMPAGLDEKLNALLG